MQGMLWCDAIGILVKPSQLFGFFFVSHFMQVLGRFVINWNTHEEWKTIKSLSTLEGCSSSIWKSPKGVRDSFLRRPGKVVWVRAASLGCQWIFKFIAIAQTHIFPSVAHDKRAMPRRLAIPDASLP